MTMVMVPHQATAGKKVVVRLDLDLDLMGIGGRMVMETWTQDLGRLALVLILRVGVRARVMGKVEGVHSLIGCLGV